MHARTLGLLAGVLVLCCLGYLTLGARAGWDFILPFRAPKLAALLLVGASVSTATVLFQTITGNRILTPAIMGFDWLYVLLVTVAVHTIGGFALADLPPLVFFAIASLIMVAASLLLFGTLLLEARQDLIRMILTGVILSGLFRAGNGFLQRMIDPNEFSVIQVASYARFNVIDTEILPVAALLTLLGLAAAWRMRHRLDVLALGRDAAINLGEDPRRGYLQVLVVVAVLVSVSTAFVGPVVFLGLIVAAIAHVLTPVPYHAVLLPSAALVSMITLVGGQAILERVLHLSTPLSVIVDVAGGAVFILLLFRSLRP
ncbi:enterobactin ABC transporter permease [Sulfitobacter alexandrii]|uniref:Enterobactin ABC transporter permease n=1 Tax=Sulfitobacter alexandrii TaxID=1917485 RepID=A0A1J0WDH0_9RHOB|nr:iron chelate uptake ABC transporter family permease subunit [Sulfitobacter alexandrii]APE42367.1 enterobactin ABC transporter permease [Sulfitobacter alexandrii]